MDKQSPKGHNNAIPCLLQPSNLATLPPSDDNSSSDLKARFFSESRAWLLHRKSEQLIEHSELTELWVVLEKSVGESGDMDYRDFGRIARLVGSEKAKKYFTAKTFAKLSRGKPTISAVNLFNFIVRKEWFCQTKIALSLYDQTLQGFLTEQDLESYMQELMPSLNELRDLDSKMYPFYVCVSVRKFFFFLDPHRTGRIRINDILASGYLDSILELRDEKLSRFQLENNWFSSHTTHRIYDLYVSLDDDQNGMLSKEEMKRFGGVHQSLTDTFIRRLFEESITFQDELDFKAFVDLILALEHKKTPAALHFFFRMLDIEGKGVLEPFTVHYFFRDIKALLQQTAQEELLLDDIITEIWDMVRPEDPSKGITCADLIKCGQGDVVISLLTDLRGFTEYEMRDSPVTGDANELAVETEVDAEDDSSNQIV